MENFSPEEINTIKILVVFLVLWSFWKAYEHLKN